MFLYQSENGFDHHLGGPLGITSGITERRVDRIDPEVLSKLIDALLVDVLDLTENLGIVPLGLGDMTSYREIRFGTLHHLTTASRYSVRISSSRGVVA